MMNALKEWATVVKALEQGKQTVILRKGGILETASGFNKISSYAEVLFEKDIESSEIINQFVSRRLFKNIVYSLNRGNIFSFHGS